MEPCNNTLSWDGILCQCCRRIFDSHVNGLTSKQESTQQDGSGTAAKPFVTPEKHTYILDTWWHTVESFQSCAEISCKLCTLTLSSMNKGFLEPSRLWYAPLRASVAYRGEGRHTLFCRLPEADPRSEAFTGEGSQNLRYNLFGIDIEMQSISDVFLEQPHELSSHSTDSDETFRQITSWLQSCKSHNACQIGPVWRDQSSTLLPTRLLEFVLDDGHPQVKLVETAGMEAGDVKYATLSYCWGEAPMSKLVRSLLQDYTLKIPWSSISRTCQDAVIAALRLDIHYLWVDALCIIQDDNDDWLYESARMAEVYSNSYLTIAADASKDGTKGLFQQRDPDHRQSFLVPHQQNSINCSGSMIFTRKAWIYVDYGPLPGRAWTIQEKFLSPRVLHFTDRDVVWECLDLVTAEHMPVSFDTISMIHTIIRKSSIGIDLPVERKTDLLYQLWYQLVLSYTAGALTFTSDRPIAISALAKTFSGMLNLPATDYLCGLWRPQLAHDLMWTAQGSWDVEPQMIRIPESPSWSWLPLCRRIWQFPGTMPGDRQEHLRRFITAEIMGAFTTPSRDPFGAVIAGEISLKVPLCDVTIRKKEPESCEPPDEDAWPQYNMEIKGNLLQQQEHFTCWPDDDTDEGILELLDNPVYLMLGRSSDPDLLPDAVNIDAPISKDSTITQKAPGTKRTILDGMYYECLILQSCGQAGRFRRVGYVQFERQDIDWGKCNAQEEFNASLRFVRDLLREHFLSGKIPDSACGKPDEQGMYTVTLV